MPTTLPERRSQPEFSPSPRQIVALGAALVLMIALIAGHARFKAWVSDALRAESVAPDASQARLALRDKEDTKSLKRLVGEEGLEPSKS
jgi:hypothetical protein